MQPRTLPPLAGSRPPDVVGDFSVKAVSSELTNCVLLKPNCYGLLSMPLELRFKFDRDCARPQLLSDFNDFTDGTYDG
jgi:hypothetical protein